MALLNLAVLVLDKSLLTDGGMEHACASSTEQHGHKVVTPDAPRRVSMAIAVVIPCYRVTQHVCSVIQAIGPEVSRIYAVDDACPDGSGDWVEKNCADPRVVVLRNAQNQGVGGAVMTGYRAALADGMDIVVKIDGDGQMDPGMVPDLVGPIVRGLADYTKGNRFFYIDRLHVMPKIRLFGNAVLSLMAKLSTGYWDIVDPTNGYTAIHRDVLHHLPFDKISKRYFFETDMLFRLNILGAVPIDIPMDAKYGDEISSLKIRHIVGEFLYKHTRNFTKRIFYNYYLRGMSLASLELPLGILMLIFGVVYGSIQWGKTLATGVAATAGTVMLSALPVVIGLQLILAFLAHDISSVPRRPFQLLKYRQNASRRRKE